MDILREKQLLFQADSLQMINLRYTSLSDKALSSLCRSLRAMPSPALSCLHLENTNMSGKNLLVLCCSLKNNDTLKGTIAVIQDKMREVYSRTLPR